MKTTKLPRDMSMRELMWMLDGEHGPHSIEWKRRETRRLIFSWLAICLATLAVLLLLSFSIVGRAATSRPISISWTDGAWTRSLPVPAASWSGKGQIVITESDDATGCTFKLGGQWVRFNTPCDTIMRTKVYAAPPTCPPVPSDATQDAACPNGGGTWRQTHGWAQSAPPACTLTALPWTPSAPRPTDCQPTTGGALRIDFGFVDRASPEYADFIAFANRTDEADPQTLAYAWKMTGDASYCARAVPQVAAWMADPNDIRGDSYLQIDQYLAPAMMVREWCPQVTTAQKAAWLTVAKGLVDEVWAQGCNGWGVCDLQNNYHDHFVRATVYVALASGDAQRIAFAQGKLSEQLAAMNSTQPNGGSLEGKGYQYATKWLNDSALVLRDSGFGDAFNANGYLSANALEWVHATTPDMQHFAPIGSQPRDSPGSIYDYQAGSVREGCYLTTDAAVRAAAGYWTANIPLDWYRANSWDNMWRCPAVPTPPDLAYNAKGVAVYARTAWNASAKFLAVVAYDRSQSHAHSEFGEVLYWLNGGWGVTSGQSLSHSGINGEPPSWSTRAKSVVGIFNGNAEVRPVESFPILSDYSENQATGDVSFCLDSTANYPGSVSMLKRCIAFVGGIVTVTDTVRLTGATSAKQQWIVPATPTCSSTICTAGALRITPVSPNPMHATIVPLSSFDSDFDRGGYRISIDCNGGCSTRLSP